MAKKLEYVCSELDKIATLTADNKWIKQSIHDINIKMDKMLEILTTGNGKISQLKRTEYGNGDPKNSLVNKCENMESYVQKQKGAMSFIKWTLGALGATNVVAAIAVILKFK